MFGQIFTSQDVVSTSFAAALIATLATAALCLLGLSWSDGRWRVPVALAGVAALASAAFYAGAAAAWLEGLGASGGTRYAAWFTVHPLQVAAAYFFARTQGPVPVGVFWRLVGAALLMVLTRYLGDARIFDPTLGALLSIAFWLYILGELYFGAMAEVARRAARPVRLGFFWIRLLLTVGWALYPILHFTDLVIGAGQAAGVVALYTVADLVNLVIPSLIVVAVAGQDRY